jgi:hypothetical protein
MAFKVVSKTWKRAIKVDGLDIDIYDYVFEGLDPYFKIPKPYIPSECPLISTVIPILVCVGWDMLELYNSGLTYRVLEEHTQDKPIAGNYPRVKPKWFIVELPCIAL